MCDQIDEKSGRNVSGEVDESSGERGVLVGESRPVVGFGNLGAANKNFDVATSSQNHVIWESRVMHIVGRVLDGKSCVDNHMEDLDDSESRSRVNCVAEEDVQNAINETISEDKKLNVVAEKETWQNAVKEVNLVAENDEIKRTDYNYDPAEGGGLISNEVVPNVALKAKRKYNARQGFFIPKARAENDIVEIEGNYYMSDLVWGKVSCHPWWPGQIFSPLSASSTAATHSKNGAYLIAYFGSLTAQTFAWNKVLKIRPFGMYFPKMGKQSTSENFFHAVQCALDEVSRRIEFGLSCPCLPIDGVKVQVTENAGINEKSSTRTGGDALYGPVTFSPGDLLRSVESFARCPRSEPERLQLTIKKAQTLAYNRWKGRYLLPVFESRRAFLEHDKEGVDGLFTGPVNEVGDGGSSVKRKFLNLVDEEEPKLLNKSNNAAKNPENRDLGGRERKKQKPKSGEMLTPELVLTKLSLLAQKPMQGHKSIFPMMGFFRDFRKYICPETVLQLDDANGYGVSSKKRNLAAGDIAMNSELPLNLQTTVNTVGLCGTNDSYWTDRIIHVDSQTEADVSKEEKASKEFYPTALVLHFSQLEAIPDVPILNQIFTAYGPLIESETKILTKSKRAKVVFKSKEDAETAFSSTGKYKTFGPSLVSYRLNIVLNHLKSKKKKKTHP